MSPRSTRTETPCSRARRPLESPASCSRQSGPRAWVRVRGVAHRYAPGVGHALGIHPQILSELDPDELGGDLTARLAEEARDLRRDTWSVLQQLQFATH